MRRSRSTPVKRQAKWQPETTCSSSWSKPPKRDSVARWESLKHGAGRAQIGRATMSIRAHRALDVTGGQRSACEPANGIFDLGRLWPQHHGQKIPGVERMLARSALFQATRQRSSLERRPSAFGNSADVVLEGRGVVPSTDSRSNVEVRFTPSARDYLRRSAGVATPERVVPLAGRRWVSTTGGASAYNALLIEQEAAGA